MNTRMASAAVVLRDPIADLTAVCGEPALMRSDTARQLAAQDAHESGRVPLAIVRPPTREVAAQAVAVATSHGLAVFPRGGGMSYTGAFLPTTERSIILDTSGLDRILHVDARGLWATVEAGVTWAALDAALKPHGVRAAFWGPFSGHDATVCGSLSQGTATFGSGVHGTSGANVLSLEVALADGRIIRTGMDAQSGAVPFFDQYGPNLTQLFANDSGALGLKLSATLPLVPRAGHVSGLSFRFGDFATLAKSMEAVARDALATEAFAMDATIAAQFSGDGGLKSGLKALGAIARGPGGITKAARAAAGGRAFLSAPGYHAHFVAEGRDAADLKLKLAAIRAAATEGEPLPDTVPSAVRAMPFSPLPLTDPKGRRVLPIHGIVPWAEALALDAAIMAIVAAHAKAAETAGLTVATSFFALGRNALLYEPVFYWADALTDRQADRAASPARFPDNPAARALIDAMRTRMIDAMAERGAAHLQIGRAYPWARGRDLILIQALKREIDPLGLINPGVLGL